MALGLEKQATYRSHRYPLEPGDTVVFVTDGILEAFNHISEHFGEERIEQLLADQARAPVTDVLNRLQDELWSFAGDRDLDDDLTILFARVVGGRRQEKAKRILTMTNRISDLGPTLDHLEELLLSEQAASGFAGEVRLLAEEAIGNVIRYAYVDDKEHTIKVTLSWTVAGVKLEICDDGIAFNPLGAPLPDLQKPAKEREEGGLGIMLMKSIAEEMSYSRVGDTNVLVLRKEFSAT
jgi:sigma-B regulation protein RsbU (phosphoserine phosphatase)